MSRTRQIAISTGGGPERRGRRCQGTVWTCARVSTWELHRDKWSGVRLKIKARTCYKKTSSSLGLGNEAPHAVKDTKVPRDLGTSG